MHTRFLFAMLCILPLASRAADPATAPAHPLKIAFTHSSESQWRQQWIKSITDEAAARKIELLDNSAIAPEDQPNFINGAIDQHVDAIVIYPILTTGFGEALQRAKDAHIPVILMGRTVGVDAALITTLIDSDFSNEGKLAADYLLAHLKNGGQTIELRGITGSAPALDRGEGFDHAIQQSKIDVVADPDAGFTLEGGKTKTAEILASGKADHLKAIFAHNDEMAAGAVEALENAGKKPGQDVFIISIDATVIALDAIKAGKINATVQCTPFVGPTLFDTIQTIAAGKKVPAEITLKEIVIDASNVDAELKRWK